MKSWAQVVAGALPALGPGSGQAVVLHLRGIVGLVPLEAASLSSGVASSEAGVREWLLEELGRGAWVWRLALAVAPVPARSWTQGCSAASSAPSNDASAAAVAKEAVVQHGAVRP